MKRAQVSLQRALRIIRFFEFKERDGEVSSKRLYNKETNSSRLFLRTRDRPKRIERMLMMYRWRNGVFRMLILIAMAFFCVCVPCFAASSQPQEKPTNASEVSVSQGIAKLGFLWPLFVPGTVTSRFGQRTHPITKEADYHMGVDIHVPHGAPIRAAKAGTVIFSGPRGGYGNAIIIQHDAKSSSLYAHCSRLHVKRGRKVHQGQVIAAVGETGRATGPHLHFEIRTGGGAVNPLEFWKKHAETSAP